MTSEVVIPTWATAVPNYPVHTEPARTGGDILPPFTWQQLQEYAAQFMNAFLAQVAIAFGGIEIAGWKPFEFLVAWGENSLQTGDPLNAEDLIGLIAEQLIPGLDATKIVSGTFAQDMITNLIEDLAARLGIDDPLNALNLFNLVPKELLGQISVSAIGDFAANLLTNPSFENLESIESSVWTWDEATSHTTTGGSAKVIADGTGSKDLLSNLVPVTEGQIFNCHGWVKWQNIVGTGAPMQLGITNYLAGSAVGQPVLMSQAPSPPTSDWKQLSGTYTVPANVDAVRLRLTVTPTATSGTVWWDDLFMSKSGLLRQLLVENLPDDLEELFTGLGQAFQDILTKAEQALVDSLMSVLGGSLGNDLEAIEDRLLSFLDQFSPLNGGNINAGEIMDDFVPGVRTTIDNLVTKLFNIGGGGYNHSQSSDALSHVADTLAGLSSQVNRLLINETSGIQMQDEFERQGSTLGADWFVTYPIGSAGTVRTDGHNAVFSKSGLNPRLYVCRFIPLTTFGDSQVVRVSLNNQADNPLLSGLTGQPGYNDVLGRMSVDNLNYIRFRIGAGHCWIYRVVNGIEQVIYDQDYNGVDPGPGSMLTLVCGVAGNARYFEGRHNNNTVITVAETGTASMLGGAFRGAGFGGRANSWPVFLTQSAPAGVRQWTGGDQ